MTNQSFVVRALLSFVVAGFLFVADVSAQAPQQEPTPDELFELVASAAVDQDPGIRLHAVHVLHRFADRPILGILLERLNDAEPDTRRFALISLWWVADSSAVPAIGQHIQVAKHDGWELGLTVGALGQTRNNKALPYLQELMGQAVYVEDKGSLKEEVADALGKIGSDEAKLLLLRMMDDPDARIPLYAAGNLALLGDEKGLKELERMGRQDKHQRGASNILAAISDKRFEPGSSPGLWAVLEEQWRRNPPDCSEIEETIVDAKAPYHERLCQLALYMKLESEGVRRPVLEKLLQDPNEDMRIHGAAALLSIGDRTGLPVLETCFHEGIKGRRFVVGQLEQVRGPVKKPLLLEAYRSDDLPSRIMAAAQLYQLSLSKEVAVRLSRDRLSRDRLSRDSHLFQGVK